MKYNDNIPKSAQQYSSQEALMLWEFDWRRIQEAVPQSLKTLPLGDLFVTAAQSRFGRHYEVGSWWYEGQLTTQTLVRVGEKKEFWLTFPLVTCSNGKIDYSDHQAIKKPLALAPQAAKGWMEASADLSLALSDDRKMLWMARELHTLESDSYKVIPDESGLFVYVFVRLPQGVLKGYMHRQGKLIYLSTFIPENSLDNDIKSLWNLK